MKKLINKTMQEKDQKFVPHPNLSDEINNNIQQSEKDGGLKLKDVKDGEVFTIQTLNTMYIVEKVNDSEYMMSSNGKICPELHTKARINGSTWGGSMIRPDFIGIGMHLEAILYIPNKEPIKLITSPIQTITKNQ